MEMNAKPKCWNGEFSNYAAFEHSFEPVRIYKVGRNTYYVFTEEQNSSQLSADWIFFGTKEEVKGWLYGAVQAIYQLKRKGE